MMDSVIEAIGNTPLISLRRLVERSGVQGSILAKLEYMNPGGSKKDRIARQIIEDAEKNGLLKPGQAVVELTSGNTGTGLAICCSVKGYPFIAVMSKGNSNERARMMRALGAEVVLVDQSSGATPGQVSGEDLQLVEARARLIEVERNAFRANQFALESNMRAHYLHTGPEILRQAGTRVDLFCDFVGSGGTYAGVAKCLKECWAGTQCFVVEPAGASVLAGQPVTDARHRIQGGGYSMADLAQLKEAPVDGYLQVTDEEAIDIARRLAREEGIFGGFSGGANVAAALQLLKRHPGKTVVCLICDTGLKYLSTDLWS